jgi:hypothetical protein
VGALVSNDRFSFHAALRDTCHGIVTLRQAVSVRIADTGSKKADVAEHPEVFRHVGLLTNKPPGNGRVALYLVIRRLRKISILAERISISLHFITHTHLIMLYQEDKDVLGFVPQWVP